MKDQTEIWKSHPEIPGIEVSTLGRVRTLDKVVSSERMTRFTKGRVLKQHKDKDGYLQAHITIDGKRATKMAHRLVAQTFIPNPNNFPQVNHKDNNPLNNNVSNLEWCTNEYNVAYREKYGTPAKDFVKKSPVYAVNLATLEVLHFHSQVEAARRLGVSPGNLNSVISGRLKQTCGYWFTNADENAADAIKHKLEEA